MTTAGLVSIGVAYVGLSALLIGFGANLAWLSFVAGRRADPAPPPPPPPVLPTVTVQLPIYNELYVVERAIDALAALDYPRDRLEIQVLDDSSDETSAVVEAAVHRLRANGVDIVQLRRSGREGYKAGALAAGLERARGELIAVLDADFVPDPDFLCRAVPHFDQPDVAFVQARWGHLNRGSGWLTRLQALAIDGHFLVEQRARGRRGYWFNFNGTAGLWRREAIIDAGGWTADTLTEDLDLSYRAHLRGWRGRYLDDVVVPGELPVHMSGFRRQQHRWARGSFECALRLVPRVWRQPVRLGVKLQATLHLTSYCIHLLLFALMVSYPLVVLAAAEHPGFRTFFGVAYPLALFSIAPMLFFAVGQRAQGRSVPAEVPRIIVATVIGPGLMLNTVRAAFQIVVDPHPEFERTAKFGLGSNDNGSDSWTSRRYLIGLDRIVWFEIALGGYGLLTAGLAWHHRNWAVFSYSCLFSVGLILVVALTVAQHLAVCNARRGRDAPIGYPSGPQELGATSSAAAS